MLKEISVSELCRYINPMNMEQDCAIAMASDGKEADGLTIGWAGFGVLWGKPTATVYVHETRYSRHIFDNAEYFSISFPEDKNLIRYFGTVSGRDEDKLAGKNISYDAEAPYLLDSRVVILCRIMGKSRFDKDSVDEGVKDWYAKSGVHTQYYGEILKVLVSE